VSVFLIFPCKAVLTAQSTRLEISETSHNFQRSVGHPKCEQTGSIFRERSIDLQPVNVSLDDL
jgi:hypothetical protein